MKRILLTLLCTTLTALSFGQKDIAVTLTSPAANATIGQGVPFNYTFTVTNNGPSDIVADDTIGFVIIMDGQLASQNVYIATRPNPDVPAGSNFEFSTQLTFNAADEQYHEICVGVFLIDSDSTAGTFVQEVDMLNNQSCNDNILITATVGTDEADIATNANTVSTFPNPATTELNFELSQGAEEVSIYDVNGKLVKTVNIEGTEETVDVTDLENGVYFYAVKFENGEVRKERFVVSK